MCAKKKDSLKAKSLPSGDSAQYVSRPRRKPDSTTKGKLNEWNNGYKEFIPQGQKASNRNMLRQLGNSSYYKSEGEKESSYTFHVNVPGDSADPVGEAYDIMKVLTEGSDERLHRPPSLGDPEQREENNGLNNNVRVWNRIDLLFKATSSMASACLAPRPRFIPR